MSSMLYKRVKDADAIHQVLSSRSQASALDVYKATKFVQLLQTAQWRDQLARRAQVVAVSPGNHPWNLQGKLMADFETRLRSSDWP